MLSAGNIKLGLIANFNLEAGKTCVGKSKLCSRLCYAKKGFFLMPNVKENHERRWEDAKAADFESRMIGEIVSKQLKLVRIHASGDFKTAAYANKWLNIITQCKTTVFFLYTRSWRAEDIKSTLWAMSRLPNMRMWLSCDRETGRPPRWRSVRFAYMSENDADMPKFPVDLIFRDQDSTPMIRDPGSGALVCPYEQGVKRQLKVGNTGEKVELKMSCTLCQLCFNKDRMLWAKPGAAQGKVDDGKAKGQRPKTSGRKAKGKGDNSARRLRKVAGGVATGVRSTRVR